MHISNDIMQRLIHLEDHDIGVKPDEGNILLDLASNIHQDYAIVEIGSYKGKSTCWLGIGSLYGHQATIYAIDLWDIDDSHNPLYHKLRAKRGYNHHLTYNKFIEQIKLLGIDHLVVPIKNYASTVVIQWNKPIGLLWIDGNHSYESCKQDYQLWSPYIISGGWIAFHDNNLDDVQRVIQEVSSIEWHQPQSCRYTTCLQKR